MKRFYKSVTIENTGNYFIVTLDKKPLHTPGKSRLLLPTERLAQGIASEWRRQRDIIRPKDMPNMSLASTAIDRVLSQRTEVINSITAYAKTDLLCYRALEPEELKLRQYSLWQPLLDWARNKFDVNFLVATGIVPIEQPQNTITAIRSAVDKYDIFNLVALYELTCISGSVIIGLAIMERYIEVGDGITAAHLDTLYQTERWGEDSETTLRLQSERQEILDAANFITLLEPRGERDYK